MHLHDWERAVSPGVKGLTRVHSEVLADLDVEDGGVGWWQGMTSWRHLALLADYLLQSLSGAATSLQYAAYAAAEHRSVDSAMDFRLRQYWKSDAATESPIPAGTDADRKSEARRAMSIEQVLYHLAQCLDRMAPAVLIVGAFNVKDVRTADWGALTLVYRKSSLADSEKSAVRNAAFGKFAPEGSRARNWQNALLEPLSKLELYGKPDWLPWLRETRNAATHRAPGIQWNMLKGRRGAPEGLHRGLARNPKWTDIENLVHQPHDRRSLEEVVLAASTPDVLDGLVASTSGLAVALGDAMRSCWQLRRTEPRVLPQPARQWSDLKPEPALKFTGDGPPVPLLLGRGATVHVGTELSRRIRAARVLEDNKGRNAWESD